MGCSEPPQIFSKVVRADIYLAPALGINVFSYLDDTLTFDLDYATMKATSYQFADLLTEVGFLLHKDKSVRNPTQRILFLGFIIDSQTLTLEIPHEKFVAIQDLVCSALQIVDEQTHTPIRFLARVVGKLISLLPATRYGKAHYRALEYAGNQALFRANHDFDAEITWPTFCRADLEWWLTLSHPVVVSFESPRFSIHMTTDASLKGWAAVVGDSSASGTWDEADSEDIALLEMKAFLLGLKAFFDRPAPITIHLSMDNTVTKAYVNHMGGRIGCYDVMACRIWSFLEKRDMFLVAFYVPSVQNCANELTRLGKSCRSDRIIGAEYQLIPRWFSEACSSLRVSPTIDWFASDDTAQLGRFCAWETSANAVCFDAYAHSWSYDVGYFFPPFSLLPRVVAKIQQDQAHGLLVVPHWVGAAWWRLVMEMAKAIFQIPEKDPYRYPAKPTLLPKKKLVLWLISF